MESELKLKNKAFGFNIFQYIKYLCKSKNGKKIEILVEKINKYFEFFRELDLKKGGNL
jgi:hypothetical protein